MVFAHLRISSSHSSPSPRSAITANNKHVLVGRWCIMQMRPVPTCTVFSACFHLLVLIFGCSIPNGIMASCA